MFDQVRWLLAGFYQQLSNLTIRVRRLINCLRAKLRNLTRKPAATNTGKTLSDDSVILGNTHSPINLQHLDSAGSPNTDRQGNTLISSFSHWRTSFLSKTNSLHKLSLLSKFRRISVRRFMEYCVTALNEASGSGGSNRFDLLACDSSAWILGKHYQLPQDADALIKDIRSKLWITYRRNFPPIDDSPRYTTDRGFGCMIRCGQMVLANALLYKSLGRDWRWSPEKGAGENPEVYMTILKLFQDKSDCPYSLHNIVHAGQQEGKAIGEWFGPNTIAQSLKRMSQAQLAGHNLSDVALISVDTALDNIVVTSEVKSNFKRRCPPTLPATSEPSIPVRDKSNSTSSCQGKSSPPDESEWLPGVLFIQLRLGLSKINPLYFRGLQTAFEMKNSLGIIGGRPNHALYLVGFSGDDVIYLDPHNTQDFIDFDAPSTSLTQPLQDEIENESETETSYTPLDSTYHCACPEKMPMERLDPSLALCFYFHSEQDFDEWCKEAGKRLLAMPTPMFEVIDERPTGWDVSVTTMELKKQRHQLHSSSRPAQDAEKFTILRDSSQEFYSEEAGDISIPRCQATSADRNVSDTSQQTSNDDEEFEMLG